MKCGKTLWIWAILLLLGGAAGAWSFQQEKDTELLKAADEILQSVVKIRGLEPRSPIPKGVKSKAEISKYLDALVREQYEEEELRREGRLLRKLGLIPPTLDYKEFTLKLLGEQIGGYYDPDQKMLFIAGWLPSEVQKPVMAHELMHALQDQHFDIGRLLKANRKQNNDDRALALQSVAEGEGVAVMLDYLLSPMGRDFTQLPSMVQVMESQLSTMDAQFEVFRQAPRFLKQTLLCPYAYGAAFLQKARLKGGWKSIDRIYSDLPTSSEQIIHPEKYFEPRDLPRPVRVEDPSSRLGAGWKGTYENVLGEFVLYLLLRTHLAEDQSRKSAAGWGGDHILMVESSDPERSVILVETIWDSEADAVEFYDSISAWMEQQFPQGGISDQSASGFTWTSAGELHRIRRRGSAVRLLVGLPEGESGKLVDYWPE